jgi:hypothetical protein
MSKLYLKIQQEILKELKETNRDGETQTHQDTEPVDPIIELANDNQFISPILQILKSYIKELSKTPASTWSKLNYALSQKNPRAEEIKKKLKVSSPGVFSWLDFSREPNPFYALYLAYAQSDQKGNWNTVFSEQQDLQGQSIKDKEHPQILFIKHFFTGKSSAISELADEVLDNSQFSILTKNLYLYEGGEKTLFYKELIKTIEVATKLTAIKKSDAKSNFASSYLPVLIKFQRVIDKQLARIEKERKDTKPENEPELDNNQKFLELSKEVVNFIKSFITNQPQQTDLEQSAVEENVEPAKRSEFERGDFNDLIKKLEEMDEFVPGVAQFFDKMEETDLELIMSDKEAQRKFNEAIRATLSTVGREIDAMAGLGKFSVSEKELKAILVKNKIEKNHPMIINTTVKAFKGLSSQKTIAQFLELVVKNSAKYANQEKEQVKPDVQKAALEVLEGKHFAKIDTAVNLINDVSDPDQVYPKNESKIRAELALFFDKPSSQLQLEILTDTHIFQFERPSVDKDFETVEINPKLEQSDKDGLIQRLNGYKTQFEAFLKVPFILDFKGDTRIGIESGKPQIELYKFFNRKFDGYEDPESVSPINFILELVNDMTRTYAGATIKLADRNESNEAITPFFDMNQPIPKELKNLSQSPAQKVVANEWIRDLASLLEEEQEADIEEEVEEAAEQLSDEDIINSNFEELEAMIIRNIPQDKLGKATSQEWNVTIKNKVEEIKKTAEELEGIDDAVFTSEYYEKVIEGSTDWNSFIRNFIKLIFEQKYRDKGWASFLGYLYKQYAPEMLGGGFLKEDQETNKYKTVMKGLKGLFEYIAQEMGKFNNKQSEEQDLKAITKEIYEELKRFTRSMEADKISWEEFKQLSTKNVGENQEEETKKLLTKIVNEIDKDGIYDKMASLSEFFKQNGSYVENLHYTEFFLETFANKLKQLAGQDIKFFDPTNNKISVLDNPSQINYTNSLGLKINDAQFNTAGDNYGGALMFLFQAFSPDYVNYKKDQLSSISVFSKLTDHFDRKLSSLKGMPIEQYQQKYNDYVVSIAKKFDEDFIVKSTNKQQNMDDANPSQIITSIFKIKKVPFGNNGDMYVVGFGRFESLNPIKEESRVLFRHGEVLVEASLLTYKFEILNEQFKSYLKDKPRYYFETKPLDLEESKQKGISNLLENLVNNYINNRKQKWQKRTM